MQRKRKRKLQKPRGYCSIVMYEWRSRIVFVPHILFCYNKLYYFSLGRFFLLSRFHEKKRPTTIKTFSLWVCFFFLSSSFAVWSFSGKTHDYSTQCTIYNIGSEALIWIEFESIRFDSIELGWALGLISIAIKPLQCNIYRETVNIIKMLTRRENNNNKRIKRRKRKIIISSEKRIKIHNRSANNQIIWKLRHEENAKRKCSSSNSSGGGSSYTITIGTASNRSINWSKHKHWENQSFDVHVQ